MFRDVCTASIYDWSISMMQRSQNQVSASGWGEVGEAGHLRQKAAKGFRLVQVALSFEGVSDQEELDCIVQMITVPPRKGYQALPCTPVHTSHACCTRFWGPRQDKADETDKLVFFFSCKCRRPCNIGNGVWGATPEN